MLHMHNPLELEADGCVRVVDPDVWNVALGGEDLANNVRAVEPTETIAKAHPNIHYNLKDMISRRNWFAHEYGMTAPIKLDQIANSVFTDLPVIQNALVEALKVDGVADP